MNSIDKKQQEILNDRIKSFIFETNLSISEIAKELFLTYEELDKIIKRIGLSWSKDYRKKMSKGQTLLTIILKKLLPGEKIVNEFHLGERLKIDVYCPSYNLGIEYHGIQHFKYVERFFDSKEDFLEAQKRDLKKLELCQKQNIALVVFRYDDKLTEESVYDRILATIKSSSLSVKKEKNSIADNLFYQQAKKKRSDYNKKIYKSLKEKKKR